MGDRGFLQRSARLVRQAMVASGADRLVASGLLWSRLRPANSQYRRPTFRTATVNGIRLRLDLSDYVQWLAYFRVEAELHERLTALARPGGVAIDVGTNIGQLLLELASRVGPSGRAIGFEPNPETYARCVENLSLNPSLHAEIHPLALGDSEGELAFGRACASNSGGDRVMSATEGTTRVPVTTLDRFAGNAGLDRVDLIKIDVEGFELHVLRGGETLIDGLRPILFIELSDDNLQAQGESARALLQWLESRGYSVVHAVTGKPIAADAALAGCYFDIICRPRQLAARQA